MNEAHFHLIVNHFPLVGVIFGVLALILGLILKNRTLKNTALAIFIIAAIFTFLSMNSGEGAEEIVEDMPNIGHDIVHEHEEIAEKFALLMYATGVFSIISLLLDYKKHKFLKFGIILTLILGIVSSVVSYKVGNSGGEIRHTEIREAALKTE